nr:SRPBCC family protein [Nocardioides sp. TF02-7]
MDRPARTTPEVLWSLMSDLERWAELLPTVDAIERLDDADASIGVGSRFRVKQPGLMPARFEVTEWHPGSGFTWEAPGPGVRTRATHTLTRQDGLTLLRLGIEWTGPLAGLIRILLRGKTRRFLALEADTFVRLAEAGAGRS